MLAYARIRVVGVAYAVDTGVHICIRLNTRWVSRIRGWYGGIRGVTLEYGWNTWTRSSIR